MNLIAHLIRFWILMAVLGSSASGADDPPIVPSFEWPIGKQETSMKEPVNRGTCLKNGVALGKPARVLFTIADSQGKLKSPKVSDIIQILKGDS